MDRALDRSLDEILEERSKQGGRGSRGARRSRGPRREQQEYPRDGVRKSFRDDAPRNFDSEWVHDRYEDNGSRRSAHRRGARIADEPLDEPADNARGAKIRVDNIHYELTQEDLEGLFEKIGPVVSLEMKYDRAGRSEGTAFVTYESHLDAKDAIREFNGANAAGQPIRLSLVPSGPGGGRRNNAGGSGRPLAERITVPGGRSRSLSPHHTEDEEAARKGIDRYRPSGQARSRSPLPNRRREGGRRPGARRDGGGGRRGGGADRSEKPERTGGRTRKTQEQLDAEMEDYFNNGGGPADQGASANGGGANEAQGDDIDMIE